MIVAGGLLAAWGALVLWFARPVQTGWRDVLRSARPGAAPGPARGDAERAARWIRRAALAGLVAGLALSAIGAIRIAVESM